MTNEQSSLRDRYHQKKNLKVAREKLVRLDEARRQKLNEEIDQKLMQTVVAAVKQLKQINFGQTEILKQARDAAVLDVTRAASGTQKNGLMNKIAGMFREKNSPLYDALAFGSAISSFYPQLIDYVEALGTDDGQPVDDKMSIGQIVQDDDMKTAIRGVISKGLRPSGALAKMGAGWAKKYLKGSIDDLVDQVMAAPIGELKGTAASVKQATSNVAQVAQAAAQRAQDPQAAPGQNPNEKIQNAFAKIKDSLGDMDDQKKQSVADILKSLAAADLLK